MDYIQQHLKKTSYSPNTDSKPIDVSFLVLHYTAASLKDTLEIFQNPSKKVSCHLIIDENGNIYEILPCLNKKPIKAFHAGHSQWKDSKKEYSQFNNISLGIELINLNGNVFPYTPKQYTSLSHIVSKLKSLYPSLENPQHILGHEHIAGFRGKADPGHQFDWIKFFKDTYPHLSHYPQRTPALPSHLKERFTNLIEHLSEKDWSQLNSLLEQQFRHHQETN